jgi:hypothetical protein
MHLEDAGGEPLENRYFFYVFLVSTPLFYLYTMF